VCSSDLGLSSPLMQWLKKLPRPCGIFCPNDSGALDILDMCRIAGIPVPEELAVLGADNEVLWCETSVPPLSSVAIPWRRVGYEAAAQLDRLRSGRRVKQGGKLVLAPDAVATRRSTDIVAISHPQLAYAMEYIRTHALEGIAVKEVEAATSVSRRQLDRLFLKALGRTPYDEIRRIQIEKAKEFLACTLLPMRQISKAVGLSPNYFGAIFHKAAGKMPLDYRHQHGKLEKM
jgi:LacI family transcriptional regulator